MLRDEIKKDISKAVSSIEYPVSSEDIEVSRTSDAKFGDFTTNIALRATQKAKRLTTNAGKNKQSSVEFAKVLADRIKDQPYIEKLEVAGPGFINIWIKASYWQEQVDKVLKQSDKYGSNDAGKGAVARVEFVSANPTGPLHFGNARGGPIGDVLASVLQFCGYSVVREYIHNDVGVQVEKLGESVLNVKAGKKLEDQEYKGEYVKELANKLKVESGKLKVEGAKDIGKWAVDWLFAEIKEDCRAMGIVFDKFYPESEFIKQGQTAAVLERIKKFLKEKDGAVWFAPSDEFLKDRETVVKKTDGNYTYFANDIAYHDLKFKENPALVIDVFGANHHGHVPRLQAVVKALGYDVSSFHVILYQWVRFKRGDELIKMSKRSGTFVTVREVLEEVGRDALRFFILMHDANSHIDFDLQLAKQKSKENPVYYVQYAHARICSILEKVRGTSSIEAQRERTSNYELLTTNYELDLIKQISRLPELVEDVSLNFAVNRLTTYAIDLADSFHKFYENCKVVGEKEDLMEARIGLINATKITLVNTLSLLGISAPEKM